MARPLRDRLIHDLNQVRDELRQELKHVSDQDLDWSPEPSMKSFRGQLTEIGWIHAESTITLTEGRVPSYEEALARIEGDTVEGLLASLDKSSAQLFAFLAIASDTILTGTIEIPQDWEWFFETTQIEREELVRWLIRHEYYHLGQIVVYNWIRGHNPYKS